MTVKMSATFFKCRRHLRRHFLTKNVGDIMSATLESCGMRATFFTIFGCKIWMIFGYKIFDGNSGGIRFGCKHRQKYMLEFCQNFGYNSGIAKFCFWARMTQNFNQNLPYFFCVVYIGQKVRLSQRSLRWETDFGRGVKPFNLESYWSVFGAWTKTHPRGFESGLRS